ncbi:MAG: hypothetical protein AB7O43_20550, partial [Hyphomicrobiaceae bacterium]
MMHVAEAGEAKGRVVLQLCSAAPSTVALEAAVWVARAFQSEIESLYVENQQLLELAGHPFVREISLTGRNKRAVSLLEIERHFRFASAEFQRRVEALASQAEVRVRGRVIRDDPVSALAAACAENGPWNLVALAEPFTSPNCPAISTLFDRIADTTGLLVVGPRALRAKGRIVLALERAELLNAMLATAERLSSVSESPVTVCLIAEGAEAMAELEAAARLALSERRDVSIVTLDVSRGSPASTGEALRRLSPGLIMCQFGGVLLPREGDLKPLA